MDSTATLSSILAMKKLCNHPVLVHPKNNNNGDLFRGLGFSPQCRHDQFSVQESGKLKVLVGILYKLQDLNEKVVVVSHYTQVEIIYYLFKSFCK